MTTPAAEPQLARLSTRWSLVHLAHHGPPELARSAVERLLDRYAPAVVRTLRAAVRDPDAADDLYQEFALRLTRGDFRAAHPDRGRFRDYLGAVLANLVTDHRRRSARAAGGLAVDPPAPPADWDAADDRAFLDAFRAAVLDRAWDALRRADAAAGRMGYAVLRAYADTPGSTSDALAATLAARAGRPVTAGWVRKQLMRARDRFADLVVAEVAASLSGRATADGAADELIALGLYEHCKAAVTRRWPAA